MKRYLKPIFVLLFLAFFYGGCLANYTFLLNRNVSSDLAFLLALIVPTGLAAAVVRANRGVVHIVFAVVFALILAFFIFCAVFELLGLSIPQAVSHVRESLYLLNVSFVIAYVVASVLSTSGKGGEPDVG